VTTRDPGCFPSPQVKPQVSNGVLGCAGFPKHKDQLYYKYINSSPTCLLSGKDLQNTVRGANGLSQFRVGELRLQYEIIATLIVSRIDSKDKKRKYYIIEHETKSSSRVLGARSKYRATRRAFALQQIPHPLHLLLHLVPSLVLSLLGSEMTHYQPQ
jgi:hypothetical protein